MKLKIAGFLAAAFVAAGSLGAAHATTLAGGINANGSRQVKNPFYTVSHPSVGRYIINFTTPFAAPFATCLFMPVGNFVPSGLVEKTSSCDVTFINPAGKLSNVLFNFIATSTTD